MISVEELTQLTQSLKPGLVESRVAVRSQLRIGDYFLSDREEWIDSMNSGFLRTVQSILSLTFAELVSSSPEVIRVNNYYLSDNNNPERVVLTNWRYHFVPEGCPNYTRFKNKINEYKRNGGNVIWTVPVGVKVE